MDQVYFSIFGSEHGRDGGHTTGQKEVAISEMLWHKAKPFRSVET
jgi:hypothetical protein